MLKVLLCDLDASRAVTMATSLNDSGYDTHQFECVGGDAVAEAEQFEPQAMIIGSNGADPDLPSRIRHMMEHYPCPIIVFTDDSRPQSINAAIDAGVGAYVVDGFNPNRLSAVMDVAMSRFRSMRDLQQRLDKAVADLDERKIVERAKGILMKQANLDEEQAHARLTKQAMDRKLKLAEMAKNIIEAHSLLS